MMPMSLDSGEYQMQGYGLLQVRQCNDLGPVTVVTIVTVLFMNLLNDKLLTEVLFFFLVCVREAIRERVRVAIIDYCNHWRRYLQALSKFFRVNSKCIFLAMKWLFLWVRYSTPQRCNYGGIFKDQCTVRVFFRADFWTHWLKQKTRVCAGVDIWWLFGC